jgi:hypothetical protein
VQNQGIAAFGLNYWSAQLAGIERIDRQGRPVAYHFRYDPTDISRISLFRNGDWVGDGYARELQQADGSYRHLSLTEWKTAKDLAASNQASAQGHTAAELALVTDLSALGKRRAQEKKAVQRARQASPQAGTHPPKETEHAESEPSLDEETKRVLRFLHG